MKLTKWLIPILIFATGCGTTPTGNDDNQEQVSAPTLELTGHRPLQNVDSTEHLLLANGEGPVINWKTTGDPTTCNASGAWSGTKDCEYTQYSPGADTIRALSPGRHLFILTAKNSAGSDSDTVIVKVAEPGERHALSDRPDDFNGEQVHILYVTPKDGEDRRLDLNGKIAESINSAQQWFTEQTDGREIKFDTYQGVLDITFVRIPYTNEEILEADSLGSGRITDGIEHFGFGDSTKKYIVVYEGDVSFSLNGRAGPQYGDVYLDNINNEWWDTALHELFHTLGVVDKNAPNHCNNRHVCDDLEIDRPPHIGDLMGRGADDDGIILDLNRDDYYSKGGLPDEVTNLYHSPYFTPPQ